MNEVDLSSMTYVPQKTIQLFRLYWAELKLDMFWVSDSSTLLALVMVYWVLVKSKFLVHNVYVLYQHSSENHIHSNQQSFICHVNNHGMVKILGRKWLIKKHEEHLLCANLHVGPLVFANFNPTMDK